MENNKSTSQNEAYNKAIEYAKKKFGESFNDKEKSVDVNVTIFDYMFGYLDALNDKANQK